MIDFASHQYSRIARRISILDTHAIAAWIALFVDDRELSGKFGELIVQSKSIPLCVGVVAAASCQPFEGCLLNCLAGGARCSV